MDLRTEKISLLDLHHTAGEEKNTEAVRRYHMDVRGYGDIGYNMVIEKDGTVGQGRDIKYKGANDIGNVNGQSMNQISFGLSHIGNFDLHKMPEVQFQSSIREAAKIIRQFGITPNPSGIRKHCDHYQTDCPGKFFPYERYVSEVNRILNPPEPIPASTPVQPEANYKTVQANGGLRVRDGQGTNHTVIGLIQNGTRVKIGPTISGWTNVYFGAHGGWVASQYLI